MTPGDIDQTPGLEEEAQCESWECVECAMCPVLMKDVILSDPQILQSYGFPPHHCTVQSQLYTLNGNTLSSYMNIILYHKY